MTRIKWAIRAKSATCLQIRVFLSSTGKCRLDSSGAGAKMTITGDDNDAL